MYVNTRILSYFKNICIWPSFSSGFLRIPPILTFYKSHNVILPKISHPVWKWKGTDGVLQANEGIKNTLDRQISTFSPYKRIYIEHKNIIIRMLLSMGSEQGELVGSSWKLLSLVQFPWVHPAPDMEDPLLHMPENGTSR